MNKAKGLSIILLSVSFKVKVRDVLWNITYKKQWYLITYTINKNWIPFCIVDKNIKLILLKINCVMISTASITDALDYLIKNTFYK